MRAVVVESPGSLTIRDLPLPRVGPYDALVRMEIAAICNSTDANLMEGRFSWFDTYPTTLGHEGVGTVVEVGEKVITYEVGDRVLNACTNQTGVEGLASGWGAMAEYALAGDFAAMAADNVCDEEHSFDGVFETQNVVPPDIPSRQAILLSTWREVYSSFSDFDFVPAKSLLIIGGGPVGLSFVHLGKQLGMEPVCLTTRSQWKLDKASVLGADVVLTADENLVERAKDVRPDGFDFAVDAVGSPTVINQALQLVTLDGTICGYGAASEDTITLDKGKGPLNWRLVMHQWPDYSKEAAAHEPLCKMIREGTIASDEFITHEFHLEEVSKGFEVIKRKQALKVLLHFAE